MREHKRRKTKMILTSWQEQYLLLDIDIIISIVLKYYKDVINL